MNNKKPKMRGINTPTPIVFFHGFLNGRFKSACVDKESNLLNSAYINGKVNLFSMYCKERIIKLETDLSAIRTEAETLIMEFAALPAVQQDKLDGESMIEEVPIRLPKKMDEAQANRAAAKNVAKAAENAEQLKIKKEQIATRRVEIIKRLVQIRNRITTKENNCYHELGATADALKERFCIYGHGVLLKPVYHHYIPGLEYNWVLEEYNADHEELRRRIATILKEEGNEYV